ncbi:MAG: ABC transporter ATP-binding protein [Candidatus Tectomicrobia bacterium]|nr:ABC transporter ATP-binding protein [Candidatus Tectomicrobia bacterium]
MSLLRVEGVSKRFQGLQALSDVSFEVKEGDIHGLIGPNGAGKTTLFNVISGQYRPDAGRVLLDGVDLTRLAPHQVCRAGVGRTFQTVRPFRNMTVLRNALVTASFGGDADADPRGAAEAALRAVGLWEVRHHSVGALNLMDQKRVELVRALAGRPRILLLDEILAGLTPSAMEATMALVRRLREESGLTILWIEHIMRVLMRNCDRVVVLNHGEKLVEGTPERVGEDARVLEAYLGRRKGA